MIQYHPSGDGGQGRRRGRPTNPVRCPAGGKAVRGGHCGLEGCSGGPFPGTGSQKLLHIQNEGHQRASGQGVPHIAADADDNGNGDRTKKVNQGKKMAETQVASTLASRSVKVVEAARIDLFAGETFGDADAGDRFVEVAVDDGYVAGWPGRRRARGCATGW